MNRRTLLKSLPATAVLPAVAAVPALAATETPVETLFREWLVLDAEEARIYAESDDEDLHGEATDRKLAVERQMRAAPKLHINDVALALLACSDYGLFGICDQAREVFKTEARALVTE